MRLRARLRWAGCVAVAAMVGCGGRTAPSTPPAELKVAPNIGALRAHFAHQLIDADTTKLTPGDFKALDHLVRAAALVDGIFRRQAWQGYPVFAPRVLALTGPDADSARDYFRIMAGPWDRVNGFQPFVGDLPHPPGAGFYPEDLTRAEAAAWLAAHPAGAPAFTSPVMVIRREGTGLAAVPYSKAYGDLIGQLAGELRDAAAATPNASLKRFLTLRAEALRSDDYLASETAWMDLDGPIEVVIGPYATREDGLFGYKASFEAIVGIERPQESERFARYARELPYLESRLPIASASAGATRVPVGTIRVVDEVIAGGEARCGPLTLAVGLPDDLRARDAKGSKQVVLKNVLRAEYDSVLAPTAVRILAKDETNTIDFDSFYHHVLFHQLAHGLGPGRIEVGGRETQVRVALKERYAAIEEAKADILAVYSLAILANRKVVPVRVVERLPWTYVAELFRAARFGNGDAHGLAAVIELNYLTSKGALETTPDGRFRPVLGKFAGAVRDLAKDLLAIEGEGSYDRAGEWIGTYGKTSEAVRRTLDGLTDVPIDVDPVFAVEAARKR